MSGSDITGIGESRAKDSPWRRCKVLSRGCFLKCQLSKFACYNSCSIILLLVTMWFLFISNLSPSSVMAVCDSSRLKKASLKKTFIQKEIQLPFALPRRHLPHCIVVGVRRTGTRALVKFLSIHPEIVPVSKELHFFNNDANYRKGVTFYNDSMPYSFEGQVTVEKTAAYFTDKRVPSRIFSMNNTIKLLIMVKDPVKRLISEFTQLREAAKKNNKTSATFENTVLNSKKEVDTSYKPVQISTYHSHMVHWAQHFSWRQIHIVDGDRFEKDPYSEIYDIETFLGVRHLIKRENFFFNATKGFFCINGGGPISPCLQNIGQSKYPYVNQKLSRKLYQFYEPYNKAFFKLVKRTFNWNKK